MSETIAFKEWSVVCEALANGRQSLILRKGGIHEGRRGFRFEHDQFALFPTRFHEQEQGVRPPELPAGWQAPEGEYTVGDPVKINSWAILEQVWTVTDWDKIAALSELHIWTEESIRERFSWAQSEGDPPALNVALVRVHTLESAWEFNYERGHGGCRSWLSLDGEPPAIGDAVLADSDYLALEGRVGEILGAAK